MINFNTTKVCGIKGGDVAESAVVVAKYGVGGTLRDANQS
jgi:hypothetical protein